MEDELNDETSNPPANRRNADLMESITPPEGTDVRAVQWRDDPAPVVLGETVGR